MATSGPEASAAKTAGKGGFFGRVFNYANNPISIAGIVIATVSGLAIVTFMLGELAGELRNPYIGIFAYLILPAVFVVGLVLIPIGMWRRRRRLLAAGATQAELERYPHLDFNNPQLRRLATVVLVLTAVNVVIFGISSLLAVEHMESVEFCGTTCHYIMTPEYVTFHDAPHSQMKCVDCHIGPGAEAFVYAKLNGLHQVWEMMTGSYDRPVPTPVHNLRPASETCGECHWPQKDYGDKLKLLARFADDETNTPRYSVMVLPVGGGSLAQGNADGTHWQHVAGDNRIRYLADETRENISWVELTTADGEVRVYTRDGEEPPAEEIAQRARLMDCIDCHNRPTHLMEVPALALDDALAADAELAALPYYKRQAVAAIEGEYPTRDAGIDAVRTALLSYYQGEQGEVWSAQQATVERAADVAAKVYGRSVFPEMKTDWASHPNHLGHEEFPGCYRCHDEELTTADGEHVISLDCESCHTFLVEDSDTPPDLAALGG